MPKISGVTTSFLCMGCNAVVGADIELPPWTDIYTPEEAEALAFPIASEIAEHAGWEFSSKNGFPFCPTCKHDPYVRHAVEG